LIRFSGEIDRVGVARHIRTARAVHRDTLRRSDLKVTGSGRKPDVIGAAPGKITGIAEHGIDNQRPGMVVAAKPEAYLVPGHGERPFDAGLLVSIHLVQHRFFEDGWAVGRTQSQIALRVDAGAGALDPPGDAAGVGAGGDDKVVLRLALVTIKDEIHAKVDLGIVDLAISRDAGAPVLRVVADEVAHHAGLPGPSYCVGLGICPDQVHAQGVDRRGFRCLPRRRGRCRLLPLQVQDDLPRSEEERLARTAREKLNRGSRLPLVRLETQWHAHELRLGTVRGQWERARVFRRKDGRSGTGLPGSGWRRLPPVISRVRGGARPAKAK
jgi:hypothetical protein